MRVYMYIQMGNKQKRVRVGFWLHLKQTLHEKSDLRETYVLIKLYLHHADALALK